MDHIHHLIIFFLSLEFCFHLILGNLKHFNFHVALDLDLFTMQRYLSPGSSTFLKSKIDIFIDNLEVFSINFKIK